jgi:polar amino acid transport system substrate-binding protein
MNKITSLFFISFLFLSSCGDKKTDNVIKFATSADYPPFEYIIDGKYTGFDIELARLIANELNKEAQFENVQFSTILPSIDSGFADAGIASIIVTPERMKNFDFSETYYFQDMVVVYCKDKPIESIEALANKRIATQLGSTCEDWLKVASAGSNIILIDNNNQAIEALKAGQIDGVLLEEIQGKTFCKMNPELSYHFMAVADKGYGIAFKKGSPLRDQVNKALITLKEKGEIERLKQKWLGE